MPGTQSYSVIGIVYSLLLVGLLYCVGLVLYRLYFHPLSKFPGSKLAAATKWYEFYFDILRGQGGTFMFELDRMHDYYGPIIRINPDELHIRDPVFYGKLYGAPGSIRNKYPPAANMVGTELAIFGTVPHKLHRQRRGAITSLYSKKTVSSYHHIIRKHVERLCKALEYDCNLHGFAELRTKYLAFSTDIICEYSFGIAWDLQHNHERALEWMDTVAALTSFTPYAKQMYWLLPIAKCLPPWCAACFSPALGRVVGMFRETRAHALKATQERSTSPNNNAPDEVRSDRTKPSQPPTIFEEILSSKLPSGEKSLKRMSEEGVVIITAGSDTVGRALTSATFHLLENPDALQSLKIELIGVMPDASVIPSLNDLEQLPFLTAVVKESLRIASILVSRLPIISPNAPLQYRDWIIPAGIPVAMTPHKTLTDPSVFDKPLTFQPQRWLGSKDEVHHLNQFFVPFGHGNRICLGINLAYAELYTAIATLFRRLDFELLDVVRERDIDPMRDCFIGEPSLESPGVHVTLRR